MRAVKSPARARGTWSMCPLAHYAKAVKYNLSIIERFVIKLIYICGAMWRYYVQLYNF